MAKDPTVSQQATMWRAELHHVAYIVDDLEAGYERWRELFGAVRERGPFDVSAAQARVLFLLVEGKRIELVQPLSGPPKRQTVGPDHICFLCDDLDRRILLARTSAGIVVQEPVPSEAFGGKRMGFIFYQGLGLVEWVER